MNPSAHSSSCITNNAAAAAPAGACQLRPVGSGAAADAGVLPLVLVVDDEPPLVAVLADVLEEAGYRVQWAHNGAEAIMCVLQEVPALLLLDVMMPEMDGWQCDRALRQAGFSIPTVFMSFEGAARSEARLRRAAGFLGKPFDFAVLVDLVERLVPRVRSR